MVFQILYQMILRVWERLKSFISTSGTGTTQGSGKPTGTSDAYRKRIDKMSTEYTKKKPPLAPKIIGGDRRRFRFPKGRIPAVLYIDDDYWDARMKDVF